jgi:hypothetical protein
MAVLIEAINIKRKILFEFENAPGNSSCRTFPTSSSIAPSSKL